MAAMLEKSKMKLYYSTTTCGAANFMACFIGEVNMECEQVDTRAGKTASGVDYSTINPKGNVPVIVLEDGSLLRENSATLAFIASKAKVGTICPDYGTTAYFQVINSLGFVNSELHPSIGSLFYPANEEVIKHTRAKAAEKLDYLENLLISKKYLNTDYPTIADFYCYIVLSWTHRTGVDISGHANVKAYYERMHSNERVRAAHDRMAKSPSTIL